MVRVHTTVEETGAMIISVVDTNKVMAADQLGTISTLVDGRHPTVVVWVQVVDNLENRGGSLNLVDKVAFSFTKIGAFILN